MIFPIILILCSQYFQVCHLNLLLIAESNTEKATVTEQHVSDSSHRDNCAFDGDVDASARSSAENCGEAMSGEESKQQKGGEN